MSNKLRLVVFANRAGASLDRVGIFRRGNQASTGSIIDLGSAAFKDLPHLKGRTGSMSAIIDGGKATMDSIREIASSSESSVSRSAMDINDVVLRAPVTPPRNIICIGKNYSDHIAEVSKRDAKDGKPATVDIPKYPMFFTKAPTTVVATGDYVESHVKITPWLDYEAELAVVIGKQGRDITAANALSYVFGYTCANDITARDIQRKHGQFFKGKTLDRSCPLGPCIVPASDLDPTDLAIQLWLNGEKKQDSRTSKMIFDIPKIIESLSQGFTLLPGDVILTGTPDGVGYAAVPPISLKHGDEMKIEIEDIGVLVNSVRD